MTTARALTQSLPRAQRTNWLEAALVASTGLVFGLYPEAAIGFACACALWGVWRSGLGWVLSRDLFILAFATVRLMYAMRAGGPIWVALLEAVVTLLLPRAAWVLQVAWRRWFGYGIVLGLCVSVGVAGVRAWSPDLKDFLIDQTRVRSEQVGEVRRFRAISRDYAWVVQSLGTQGPATVEYRLEVRTSRPYEFMVVFLHPGLPENRQVVKCKAQVIWSTCFVSAKLINSGQLNILFGGNWSKKDPAFEVRGSEFQASASPGVIDRLRFASRQAGTSFNENAFGAWVTVAALVALCAVQGSRAHLIALIPLVIGAYLSGSRGALLAGLLGVLTVTFARSRYAKLLGPLLLIGCFVAIEAQVHLIPGLFTQAPTSISPSFRALNLNDPDTLQMRVDIWQSAVTKILSQPIFGPVDPRDLSKPHLVGQPVSQWTHAHDLWLQMLIEGGLLQLTLLITLVLFAVWRLARSQNARWLAPLVAILLINIADFIFYYAPIRLAFGLLLGLRSTGWLESDLENRTNAFNPVSIVTDTQKQPVIGLQAVGEIRHGIPNE